MSESIAVASVVLAGGQGTRLFPITLNHCKPAVPFGGRYRLIDIPISNSIHSDIRQIFVIAQFLTTELQHHLNQAYHFDPFYPGSIDLLTPEEKSNGKKQWFKGTADAIRKNMETLLKAPVDYYLILSGDQLYNIDFNEMLDFALKTDADLVIASLPVKAKDTHRLGILKLDQNSKVIDFFEKPKDPNTLSSFEIPPSSHTQQTEPHYLASMGIYIFKRSSFIQIMEKNKGIDFGKHLIPSEIKKRKTFSYVYKGYWEDIGTISSFYEANLALTRNIVSLNTYDEQKPIFARSTHLPGPKITNTRITDSIISEGAVIEAKEITHSIIGLRSHIQKDSVIKDSVIMGSHFYCAPTHQAHRMPETFGIGQNCLIKKAIIDEHVLIGNHVKLINEKNITSMDGDGIFIREGIIVVTAGTKIPDHFTL